jgi:hypothetical protein
MNDEDRKRFARYYPGYVEPPEIIEEDNDNDNNKNNENQSEKKHILGYIDKIDINKNKLIIDTIVSNTTNSNNNSNSYSNTNSYSYK